MSAEIEIVGLEPLIRKLDSLGKMRTVKLVMKAAGLYVKGKVSVAPAVKRMTRASVYGEPFKTERQRRFFFAAMRNGTIEVPYIRNSSPGSEAITKRWGIVVSPDGMEVTIGNNASYARLVHGADGEQSKYLGLVGWRRADEVAQVEQKVVYGMIEDALQREIAA